MVRAVAWAAMGLYRTGYESIWNVALCIFLIDCYYSRIPVMLFIPCRAHRLVLRRVLKSPLAEEVQYNGSVC